MEKVVAAEEAWLNEENPFDFDYVPFEGDRLFFVIGGEEIAFSFFAGLWTHRPHQAFSMDDRMGIDAESEDRKARQRALSYLQTLNDPPA